MWWFLTMAVLVVLTVAGSVLPRRADRGSQDAVETRAHGFPWFWVVFPFTCVLGAAALATLFQWMPSAQSQFGWTMYLPEDQPGGSDAFSLHNEATIILPIVSAIGIGLSIWAWRKRWV